MRILDRLFGRKKGPGALYREMRDGWLTRPLPDGADEGVQAVMMEIGMTTARACVLAAPDGSASLYLETGGGTIGGHGVPRIAEAARALVRQASRDLPRLALVAQLPTTAPGGTTFAVRTAEGARVGAAPMAAFTEGAHPLGELFARGQDLLTEFRRFEQSRTPLDVYLHADGGLLVSNASNVEPVWCTLEQLRASIAEAADVGARLRLHAPASGDRAFAAVREVLDAVPGWEVLPAPETWTDGASSLEMAIAGRRVDITRDLVARGADLNARDVNGYDALMVASNVGTAELVEAVIQAGADPNRRDPQGNTPLMFAAQRQDSESVAILLRAGADPGVRGSHGLTALGIAKQYPGNPAARTLAASGAPE